MNAPIDPNQPLAVTPDELLGMVMGILSDGLDHPEVWDEIPAFCEVFPDLTDHIDKLVARTPDVTSQALLVLLKAVALAGQGAFDHALTEIEPLAVKNSQSALVQGALFRVKALRDPDNPQYDLTDTFCSVPFQRLDVLEASSHLCCASWLHASAGDMQSEDWRSVWNSETAQKIRQSIHDGSYRYCNKSSCPKIAGADLPSKEQAANEAPKWARIIGQRETHLAEGPETVNLAYDRTCNLACPSCRTEKFAADSAMRERFATMQDSHILPLLKHAETVFITGSGDPFASKNFRALITALNAEEYPNLGFRIMTNAMLLTPKQWAEFPTLHGRTRLIQISIDAATGPTHEKLRLGAKWPVMLENMAFAGELVAKGDVDVLELVFVVQRDNYTEMGDAVDLAKQVGAQRVYFARLTNWGTFSEEQFAARSVCAPSHPEHGAFLSAMQDPRLQDPMVLLGDIAEFVDQGSTRPRDILKVA